MRSSVWPATYSLRVTSEGTPMAAHAYDGEDVGSTPASLRCKLTPLSFGCRSGRIGCARRASSERVVVGAAAVVTGVGFRCHRCAGFTECNFRREKLLVVMAIDGEAKEVAHKEKERETF